MRHFVTEMCTCVHRSVIKWCIVRYLSNVSWDLWDGSIMVLQKVLGSVWCLVNKLWHDLESIVINHFSFKDYTLDDIAINHLEFASKFGLSGIKMDVSLSKRIQSILLNLKQAVTHVHCQISPGMGFTNTPLVNFSVRKILRNSYIFWITFILDGCHHSWAAEKPVKRDAQYVNMFWQW